MTSIQPGKILETVKMVANQHSDVRIITIGIDLRDCISTDIGVLNQNIYNEITTVDKDLVATARHFSAKCGVLIMNQRIPITPIAQIAAMTKANSYISVAQTLDKAAKAVDMFFIGGFPMLVQKGVSPSDKVLIRSIPEAMKTIDIAYSSINIDSTHADTDTDAIKLTGGTIKRTTEIIPEGFDYVKTVVFCNAVEGSPFMVDVFHDSGKMNVVINVGIPEPDVIKAVLENSDTASPTGVTEIAKKAVFKITHTGELIDREASKIPGIPSGILNLPLVPTPAVGGSVARILGEIGSSVCGIHGTTAALALLNDTMRKDGMMVSSAVDGLSDAFIPVSEDEGMITAAEVGMLTLGKLETMTTVRPIGLDMTAVPGNTPTHTISGVITDKAAASMISNKTTAMHVIPVAGEITGNSVEFDGLLGYAPVMPVEEGSCEVSANHGGRIPAPVQSMKN